MTVESAGRTITAVFSGGELLAGSVFEETSTPLREATLREPYPMDESRYHLDLSVRMISMVNLTVTQEA